jgi:hypothetical protein
MIQQRARYGRMACNGRTLVSHRPIPFCGPHASQQESELLLTVNHLLGGGMPTSTNRTLWPVQGGAVAIQPGWFSGHATAFIYINMGYGTIPLNMSHPMVPAFQIVGPTTQPYPGTFCLPQVPLPVNASVNIGDNATIQIIETAVHGASLYNCVDITFADPKDVPEVNETNCFNSSDISFQLVFTTTALSSDALPAAHSYSFLAIIAAAMLAIFFI